jgi:alpha-D-ribose 1-methylphosphonate 5-triphosphate synthase subunit PhnG
MSEMNVFYTVQQRQRWMNALACASCKQLDEAFRQLSPIPIYRLLRRPESGSIMLRGRIGGTGAPFNLGEATVTRCTVEVNPGMLGTAYILGRDPRKAELAAVLDALLQDENRHERLMLQVIQPLREHLQRDREEQSRKAAATKVDFFTMVRGE